MDHQAIDFKNEIQITVRSGETGKVLHEIDTHNDISDDMLAAEYHTYFNAKGNTGTPWCFLLQDGPLWSGFTWDRTNPWAPYCYSQNNLYQGVADTSADMRYAGNTWTWDAASKRHKFWFRWTKLADDITLRAFGLTGWNSFVEQWPQCYGIQNNAPVVFCPQSLVVLPTPILIHGRKAGSQIPDTLELSYYLSLVGVN